MGKQCFGIYILIAVLVVFQFLRAIETITKITNDLMNEYELKKFKDDNYDIELRQDNEFFCLTV